MTPNDDWVENEIKLAKAEACGWTDAQLDAAYKAYKNLKENDHTGNMVIGVPEIINRLLERKPLTPIQDVPETWEELFDCEIYKWYRCKRMPSVYKYEYVDGDVEIIDVNRVFFVDINTRDTIRSFLCYKALNRLYPIEMPYYPPLGYFRVYGILDRYTNKIDCRYLIEPDGKRITLTKSNWITDNKREQIIKENNYE